MIVTTMIVIVAAVCSQAESQSQCLFQPLPGPDIYYDFYGCSYVLNWSRNFPRMCKDVNTSYEVQFLYDCNNDSLRSQTFNTTNEQFSIPEQVLQQCFELPESTACYARVRAQMNEASWSEYSAWTNLSKFNLTKTIQGWFLCM